jgi:hypothetical protein
MATNHPHHCYVCNLPPEGHNQRTAHTFWSNEDAQRKLAKSLSLPILSTQYVMWIASLQPKRERLIWCDECHYWHNTVNECAYSPKVGA